MKSSLEIFGFSQLCHLNSFFFISLVCQIHLKRSRHNLDRFTIIKWKQKNIHTETNTGPINTKLATTKFSSKFINHTAQIFVFFFLCHHFTKNSFRLLAKYIFSNIKVIKLYYKIVVSFYFKQNEIKLCGFFLSLFHSFFVLFFVIFDAWAWYSNLKRM